MNDDRVVTAEAPGGIRPDTDSGYAPDRWAFDDEVTRVFDDMLARSIPQYDVMRETVFRLADDFLESGTGLSGCIDIGASRGEALAGLVRKYGAIRHFVAAEVSPPMLVALRERFAGMIEAGVVEVLDHDLRDGFPPRRARVVLAVLTMMFVPIEHRAKLVVGAYESLEAGGAMIVVEKITASNPYADALLAANYREFKKRSGYSDDEIDRKALALEGVLVPATADWNESLLRGAGFDIVEPIWRWYNFAGWVAIKR